MADPTHRSQGRAIYNLNQYLQWHDLPVRMNDMGVCNGLVAVHAQYTVQGKEDAFFDMLDKVAFINKDTPLDSKVNHFVTNVVLAHLPNSFDKASTQDRGVEALTVEGKHLKSTFQFGMVANEQNWIGIIKELDLQENETMIVRGSGHAVSVSKKEGEYKLYDPNYDSGFKTFSNEKKLLKELQQNVLHTQLERLLHALNGPLGMYLQVIRNPNEPDRNFPERTALYEKYVTESNIHQTAPRGFKDSINTMSYAIRSDDNDAVNQLFEQGFESKESLSLVNSAIAGNKLTVLNNLLDRIPENEQEELQSLFKTALDNGRKEAFDMLKEHNVSKPYFENLFKEDDSKYLLARASSGGNVALLEDVLNHYEEMEETDETDEAISKLINFHVGRVRTQSMDVVGSAIGGGNVDCAKLLIDRLDKTNSLTEERALNYLTQATMLNKPHLVDFFADTIESHFPDAKDEMFASIKMTTTAVEQTDLSILRRLKDAGVSFSKESEGVIATKEARPVGHLLSMGIMLNKFTDYVKEKIFGYEGVTYDAKKIEQADKNKEEPQEQQGTLTDEIMSSKLPGRSLSPAVSSEEGVEKNTAPTPFSKKPPNTVD